jgi:Flp pilus assembly protein TadD
MQSRQFDRAIERFSRVVRNQPENVEAILNLAEAYEQKGDKPEAIRWYGEARKRVSDSDLINEIEERIKSLQ